MSKKTVKSIIRTGKIKLTTWYGLVNGNTSQIYNQILKPTTS